MSTTNISNVSLLRELQSFQQDRPGGQTTSREDSLTQNQAFVVTLNFTQGASQTESSSQPNHGFYQQRKADLAQLGQALQSGDAEAAQQAYDALVALGQNGPLKNGQAFHRSDRAQDFGALGEALASGDLAGATSAFNALASTFGDHGNTVGGLIHPHPLGPPDHVPPQSTLPPTIVPPPAGGPSGPPEIIINVGGTLPAGNSGDIVVNLPQRSTQAEEVQINFGDQQGSGGQLSIDVHPQKNGGEAVSINLSGGASHYQLVLNLFQSAASGAAQSGSLSLSA